MIGAGMAGVVSHGMPSAPATRRRQRYGGSRGSRARRRHGECSRQGTIRLADDEQLVVQALLLAGALGHKVPDCVCRVLAEREGCALATADGRLGRLARSRKIPVLGIGTAAGTGPATG